MDFSHDTFYRYQSALETGGVDAFHRLPHIYLRDKNEYRCSAGQQLLKQYKTLAAYRSSAYCSCEVKAKCTSGEQHRVIKSKLV